MKKLLSLLVVGVFALAALGAPALAASKDMGYGPSPPALVAALLVPLPTSDSLPPFEATRKSAALSRSTMIAMIGGTGKSPVAGRAYLIGQPGAPPAYHPLK